MKKTVLGDPEKEDEDEYKDDPDHWVLDREYSKRHKLVIFCPAAHVIKHLQAVYISMPVCCCQVDIFCFEL